MLASELPGILRHATIDVRVILPMSTLMFLWKLCLLEENYLKHCLLDFSSLAPHLLNQFSIRGGCGRIPGNMNQMLLPKNGGICFLSIIFKLFLGGGCFMFRFIIFRCAWPQLQVLNHPILSWTIISTDFTDYSALPLWFWPRKKIKLVATWEVKQCWRKFLEAFWDSFFFVQWLSISLPPQVLICNRPLNKHSLSWCCCSQPGMNLWKRMLKL